MRCCGQFYSAYYELRINIEITRPYSAIPSARATKIRVLPIIFSFSLIAPIAADAADATAIPPPTPLRPVERAAPMNFRPSPTVRPASAPVPAARALTPPPSVQITPTPRILKNEIAVHQKAFLTFCLA